MRGPRAIDDRRQSGNRAEGARRRKNSDVPRCREPRIDRHRTGHQAIKHAFNGATKDGQITVAFDVSGTDWKLSVTDNGTGTPDGVFAQPKTGLGTGIVNALAKQLNAKVETVSGPRGTSVSVTHATFAAKKAQAA